MKLAVATMFHQMKAYSFQHWFAWASSLRLWEEYPMFILSRDSRTAIVPVAPTHIPPIEFIVKVHSGRYGDTGAVKRMRELIRLDALRLGVDALYMSDCDTIPPPGALSQLLASDGDIVTAIYFDRNRDGRAVCWRHDDQDQSFIYREKVSEVDGAGMGACLIKRHVLEQCDWNYGIPDDDYVYWMQAKQLGFRCLSLNTVICKHYITATEFADRPTPEEVGARVAITVKCPDGVTINGRKYKGQVFVSEEMAKSIKEIDRG